MATLDPSVIPAELANRSQWLVWKFEPGEKKPKKMPYYASGRRRTGKQGSAEDRSELVSLPAAMARLDAGYSGIGFAFLPGDGLIGIDIDGCIDEKGAVAQRAADIIKACGSYTEYSPSRKGVHIIVSGETKTFKSNDIGLEVFCGAQFFTFTASPFPGTPDQVAPIDARVLNRLQLTVQQAKGANPARAQLPPPAATDERAKLDSALACINPDCGYDDWIRVGMGIYAALGPSGLAVWDYWSSRSSKYAGVKDLEGHWKSFGGDGGITVATVYKMAVDAGWRPPRTPGSYNAPVPAAQATHEVPTYLDEVPPPSAPSAAPEAPAMVVPTFEVLLSHFSLIYPTTDVWDSLRKQRLKKSAFTAWVGKDLASTWEKDPKRRTIQRDSLPTLIGGKAVEGGAGGGKLGEMLDNLTLLRGTETVWDGIGQQVMTLGAVRADYTAELTSKWQEHAQRKTIEARNLVFDPTQTADPVSHVNIFLGWPLSPKENDKLVEPILALLASLCDAEDKVAECVEWILRWLAYPLQHPGAKMQTALLMFGEKQGTGKSLFFQDVMLPIYGDYGTVASQHQLDSSFTAWRSRKLFVLFEEVLSRDDKYSHNGTLKYMITGKTMSINQKNLPERDERNHMNSAFLSNEPQPIPIELEDRRFMVIEARRKQDPDFYAEVQRSIVAGGIEAFYHFLLNLPLDDFNEHTKPPMTLAKERVIEFGLAGWMSFHRTWKDGYLDAPYCSCLSEDLYIIYKRWCDKSGEKPLTLCKFAGLIASREHKAKKSVAVDSKHKKTRMVFVVENPDHPEDLEAQIAKFRKLGDVRADRALQG
ncbi:DUF5906 domain-containing protein [Massilia varians]|uniref:DUF5906 domain-containing protein n=1 Tax=Massilia varians TaxID=457921 RepID=UPI002556D471|nr:PriCT-2 domain-containing protein [Massilia varians]MDK6078938.1 PriCT-2 domain-containing protein [Massilia varians]